MIPHSLPSRQVHLDFHTSPAIEGIGMRFDKGQWQDTLREARVNSITLFSKCHHGYSYHPTKVGKMHPHLNFDLLRAQFDACKEAGIAAPVYLSAGVDNYASEIHPEWRELTEDGAYSGWVASPLKAGFHAMDFFSPYVEYLCDQIREAVGLFPDCDGIFLDIVHQSGVCSKWGMAYMAAHDLNPESAEDRARAAEAALERYYRMTTEAARSGNPQMPIFHNSSHIRRGRRDVLKYFSHLELESLPTGGWGYDHFPMSAKYAAHLGLDFVGMTGKFHTTWGEFGGYKHPNALRYECAAMQAFNSKCCVGDQLHPDGSLDRSTYRMIGSAYREAEAREPWCVGACSISDVAVLSSEAETANPHHASFADEGASRMLLEEHLLFDLIDRNVDFSPYRVLVLPDDIRIDPPLKERLDAYLAQGGKLLLTGESGLRKGAEGFAFELGATHEGASEYCPDYLLPAEGLRPDFLDSPMVMYTRSQRIRVTSGQSLGAIHHPWFNRTYRHFCSHQHAPARPEASGYDGGVRHGGIAYLAHPVFSLYRFYGAVVHRHYVGQVLKMLLGDSATVETNLPSTARVALNHQPEKRRYVLHLLYGNTPPRGGNRTLPDGTLTGDGGIPNGIIEELVPIHGTKIVLRNLPAISSASLEPQGVGLAVRSEGDSLHLTIDSFSCSQLIVLNQQ